MRLIDNHRQVVSSEKGAVYDTSAEVSSAPRTKGRSIIGPDNPNSKLAGQFPAVARAITMEIKNNPNNLHVRVAWQFEDTKTSRDEKRLSRAISTYFIFLFIAEDIVTRVACNAQEMPCRNIAFAVAHAIFCLRLLKYQCKLFIERAVCQIVRSW